MPRSFIAHTRDCDTQEQLLLTHLSNTANLTQSHAAPWGGDFARVCGLSHDIGKYSAAFQERIRGKNIRVDHATAGGQLLREENSSVFGCLAAYCVLGHHGGLPNGGFQNDGESDSTLYGRLKKRVENYIEYQSELTLPRLEPPNLPFAKWDGFDAAFFTRMIFSALVDADWLDTEEFCNGEATSRGGFAPISALHEKMTAHVSQLLNAGYSSELNERRNALLSDCISAASLPPGLFTLTAPTGSGKTKSSLAFALEHAVRHNKKRIIFVIPYNSIAEQNSEVFEELLGAENVLVHNSGAQYDGKDDEYDEVLLRKRHSVENWDYPIIVTSSVQFFESLFASKPSRCRKLHNISESVIIFDEAQMIPVPFLIPCTRAIKTLVTQYGCTAVLATATQSALDRFFEGGNFPLAAKEIARNPVEMYGFLRRATIHPLGEPLTDAALSARLAAHEQILCIVNTRRHAQKLFEQLKAESADVFHLSTTMYPAHRKRVLQEIRERLKGGLPCRVISTSLVEAGVDVDFSAVYRERAGLDSIVQAAGRCNREGKRPPEESIVYVFESADAKAPRLIQANLDAYGQVARKYTDLAGLDAIREYFTQLFYNVGDGALDAKKIMPMFNDHLSAASFAFEDAAQAFKLIDDSAQQTVYVLREAPELEARLQNGERSRELFRALGAYGVTLFSGDIKALDALGAIERLDESVWLLQDLYYNETMGVTLSPEGGQALVV